MKTRNWMRALRHTSLWVGAVTAAAYSVDYALDARVRTQRLPQCQWTDFKPDRYAHPYLARWCYLKREMVVVRLFDEAGRRLLAERTLEYPIAPRVFWEEDQLELHGAFASNSISLPPTLLDRLRLKLP